MATVEYADDALALRVDDAAWSLHATGEMDASSASLFTRAIGPDRVVDRDMTVDLGGVTFIDAAGLGVLVRTAALAQAAGYRLNVVNAKPSVARVFGLAALAGLLTRG